MKAKTFVQNAIRTIIVDDNMARTFEKITNYTMLTRIVNTTLLFCGPGTDVASVQDGIVHEAATLRLQ